MSAPSVVASISVATLLKLADAIRAMNLTAGREVLLTADDETARVTDGALCYEDIDEGTQLLSSRC